MLNRSPFYVSVPLLFSQTTAINFSLFIWTGDIVSDKPTTATVTKTIQRATASQTFIDIDISPFVNDVTETDFRTFTAGVQPSSTGEAVWVSWLVEHVDSVNTIPDITGTTLSLSGYTYYKDGVQGLLSNKILLTNTQRQAHAGLQIIPFINDGTFTSVNGTALTPSDVSEKRLSYYVFELQNDTDIVFTNGVDNFTVSYEMLPCSPYTPVEVLFVNRFGALEQVPFSLASQTSISTSKSSYKNNLVTAGSFNPTRHLNREFNKNGKETLIVNTDFLNESYNETFRELKLSERVWADGRPVNLKDDSLAFKTRLKDKVIQYSFSFDRSHNLINDV